MKIRAAFFKVNHEKVPVEILVLGALAISLEVFKIINLAIPSKKMSRIHLIEELTTDPPNECLEEKTSLKKQDFAKNLLQGIIFDLTFSTTEAKDLSMMIREDFRKIFKVEIVRAILEGLLVSVNNHREIAISTTKRRDLIENERKIKDLIKTDFLVIVPIYLVEMIVF